ncbi:f4287954-6673-4200-ae0c-b93129e60dc2 [Thermothielavioides terrestris]|uniref:F-box domain-containing protein n=2 Tax=Thermothielavioides terrestris TaxID=2587410 RepID=G2RFD4_THETT|nr:uncharacterized protein THITE_2121846 [Thermothielavioides terrestris NRRL 8126]AEO70417.1 hypothetical protein THITE_2121846 [Thermothielavioides terrestris NRRL 8126]SPQ18240.1 f4287954-6673-4200-ae0c-b93129e60dc2 [Thermothielavioides terrestris]
MRDFTELPWDIFVIVISYLSPQTCVRCRAVSRQWYSVFTSERVSLRLLRWNFPLCRELRLAAAAGPSSLSPLPSTALRNHRAELIDVAERPFNWAAVFAEVSRRYYHLSRGRPRVVEKIDLAVSSQESGSPFSFYGVATWNRFLRLNDKTSSFHYPDPVWWYSQEDGLLVYPAALGTNRGAPSDRCDGHVYLILDPATGQRFPVPFDVRSKHIRRVRLAQGVLIFEWAEALPYHQLNAREFVHRHFVTAFDVVRHPTATTTGPTWTVEFRSEWKLHFLGLPLNRSDRFFSAHTATHYAVYFWQPNRSLYQDDPIEQLAVWDISSPSPYRPSEDPRGGKRPAVSRAPSLPPGLWNGQGSAAVNQAHDVAHSTADRGRPRRISLATATAGPQVIRRMDWRELDFYGLRQRSTPQLRGLALDDRNLYVIEEEHRWADGQHSSLSPPRVHLVRSTGIPIIPTPSSPTQAAYPAASRSTGDLTTGIGQLVDLKAPVLSTIIDGPVHGPIWVDTCGADGDVHMNFCRRVSGPRKTYTSVPASSEGSLDAAASTEHSGNDRLPQASSAAATGWPWEFGDNNSASPFSPTGSTRWPGWAPCWRHEDFPYLTVTEMVDVAAGVRVTARHCFMLETLSVHVRPAVSVLGAPPVASDQDNGGDTGKKTRAKRRLSNEKELPVRSKEVFFSDEMWSELVARGHIAGDERWVVGEDEKGRVTLLRF